MNPLWLIMFAIGTLLLRAGFALQAAGSLRAKNATGAMLRITADTAAAALAFWAVGGAMLLGTAHRYFMFDSNLFMGQPPEMAANEFFHLTISLIGCSIVTGALAERTKFYVGVITSAALAGVVMPIIGHWVWFGWLRDPFGGVIDYGGATVIHLSAAVFAAVGVAVVGARKGKFNSDRSSNSIPGHALPLLGAGTLLIFAGWFPYVLGCTLTHWSITSTTGVGISAMNVMLAGSGGVAGGLIFSQIRYRKPDVFFTYAGLLGGLVAITPDAVAVSGFGAVTIGLVAGVIVPITAMLLDTWAHLDDPLGLIAIHGIGSIWGMLAATLFIVLDRNATLADHMRILAAQSLGIVAVMVPSTIVAAIFFVGIKSLGGVRVSEDEENQGLDLAEHGVDSYPDFAPATVEK